MNPNILTLHILKAYEFLRVSNQVWDSSSYRKVSIAFVENKLLHSSQHHPERWALNMDKKKQNKNNVNYWSTHILHLVLEKKQHLRCYVVTLVTIEEVFHHIGDLQEPKITVSHSVDNKHNKRHSVNLKVWWEFEIWHLGGI